MWIPISNLKREKLIYMHTGRNFGSFKGLRSRSPRSGAKPPSDHGARVTAPWERRAPREVSTKRHVPTEQSCTSHSSSHHPHWALGFFSIKLGAVTVGSVAPRGAPGPRAARSPSQEARLHHSPESARAPHSTCRTPPLPAKAAHSALTLHPAGRLNTLAEFRGTPEPDPKPPGGRDRRENSARSGPAPAPRRTRTRAFPQTRKRISRSHGRARVSECRIFLFMLLARSSGPASTPSFGGRLVRLKSLNPLRPSHWELVPIAYRDVAVRRSEPCRSVRDPGVCPRFRYRSEAGTGPSLASFGSC